MAYVIVPELGNHRGTTGRGFEAEPVIGIPMTGGLHARVARRQIDALALKTGAEDRAQIGIEASGRQPR
jgi:hypothetical protein